MRVGVLAVLMGLALAGAGPGYCQTDKSVIDLHGQDALAFTMDDTLRVHAAMHSGAFWLSHNGVNLVNGAGAGNNSPEDYPEIGYFNLSDMTCSRARINMSDVSLAAWEPPRQMGQGTTCTAWSPNDDHYISGNALEHDLDGIAGDENHPALYVKPEWMKMGSSFDSMIDSFVKEVRVERLVLPKCEIVGVMRMSDYKEGLCGSLRVVFSTMWIYLKGIAAFFMGSPISFGGAAAAPGSTQPGSTPSTPPPVDPQIAQQINQAINASNPPLAGKVTPEQVAAAARAGGTPSCNSIAPNLTPQECTAAQAVVAGVTSQFPSDASSFLGGAGSFIQSMIDDKCNFQGGNPDVYGWAKWRDPLDPNAPGGKIIASVMQSKMKDRMREFVNSPDDNLSSAGDMPVKSGAYLFNSLFLYSPRELYLLDCNEGPGLVENFAYARLNKIDPHDPTAVAAGKARWKMLDLVTLKKLTFEPPMVQWPPQPASGPDCFGGGTAQVVGDEAAIGTQTLYNGGTPPPPTAYSAMLVSVNPQAAGLNIALKLRILNGFSASATAQESPWTQVKNANLPPNYKNNSVGAFRVGVANAKYAAAGGFNYGWDFDNDGNFDSIYGNTTRQLDSGMQGRVSSPQGAWISCYVVERDASGAPSGATGVGVAHVLP